MAIRRVPRSCLPSARVRPRVARSVRLSGRAIRMTSVLRSSPAAPMLTSFTIQATLSPPHRSTSRKVPSWTCTPNLAAVPCDEVVDRLARHRLAALGDEQPGQCVRAGGEIAADGAQLVAGDGLLDREAALEAAYPQPGAVEVERVPAQTHG